MGIDLQLFKNRNFLFYWLSGWITSLGESIFVIALTWMLVKKTGSPSIVGMYLFVLGISKMVFILVGGIIVDRMDAKKLILFSNLIRAALIFALFFLSHSPLLTILFFFCMAADFNHVLLSPYFPGRCWLVNGMDNTRPYFYHWQLVRANGSNGRFSDTICKNFNKKHVLNTLDQ